MWVVLTAGLMIQEPWTLIIYETKSSTLAMYSVTGLGTGF
jgi:hypothetical protein